MLCWIEIETSLFYGFGAGTGWLSKVIWQMGCPVVSLDVSQEALDFGKRLFEDFPVVYDPKVGYEFLLFDGHRIDLPDDSVDRIVCYDVFHHVPNQETVMREFHRILAPGGMIGFNEPLGEHSASVESQYEMRTYKVLENDLDMDEIARFARSVGLDGPKFEAFCLAELELDLEERRSVCEGEAIPERLLDYLRDSMRTSGVFCFKKGEAAGDSRSAEGLAHVIEISSEPLRFRAKTQAFVEVKVSNVGDSKWLRGSPAEIGTVNVGTQLFDTNKEILAVDLTRAGLPGEVLPGESVVVRVPLVVMEPGHYKIGFDLVSELVTWFHMQGSEMVYLDVEVYA